MSKVLGIWGEVPGEKQEWFENTQIPEATKRLGTRAFYFQAGENMFPEENRQTATSFTLYDSLESPDSQLPIEQTLQCAGSGDALKNVFLQAQYHTCQLEEMAKSFSGGESSLAAMIDRTMLTIPDYAEVGCLVMGMFHPTPEMHDAFFEWWRGEFVPFIQQSPDFLRVRLWKLDAAADLQGQTIQKRAREELFPYVMAYEFQSYDMPWEVVIEIGQSKAYQDFVEKDLVCFVGRSRVWAMLMSEQKYRYGVYHLKKIYNAAGEVEAEFNDDDGTDSDDAEEE
jgi:hypothetical protein